MVGRDERTGRDRAYAYLREQLLTDPTLQGGFVNEQDAAEVIGVSRTPVREALLMLSAERLVQLVPHRGAFVPQLTGARVEEILDARRIIESACARAALTAGERPGPVMAALVDRQREAIGAPDHRFLELDRDFHATLVAAAGNRVLTDMYESLRMRHVLIGVQAVERGPMRLHDVVAEHERIVAALDGCDAAAAEAAIADHLRATHRRFVTA